MKPWLLLAIAFVLALGGPGCKQKSFSTTTKETLMRQAGELEQPALMKMFLEALENQPCATNVSARFQTTFNEAIVQKLLEQAPSELRRKLETLERNTNRHPFTEDQLKEALRRKERQD